MKIIIIKLLHGHTVTLRAPDKRIESLLRDLESAKINKKLAIFRNAHSGVAETLIDGNAIVAWELTDRTRVAVC